VEANLRVVLARYQKSTLVTGAKQQSLQCEWM
jgi:hypothetical protein